MLQFSWDQANIDHIARHNITPDEVEQVVNNDPFDICQYIRNGEERLNQIGETNAGRVLVVITTERDNRIRVVTAHPADRTLRKLYEQWKEAAHATDPEDTQVQE